MVSRKGPVPVLLVDDDPQVHEILRKILSAEGSQFRLVHATQPEEALDLANKEAFFLALVDLHFAGNGKAGFALLESLRDLDPKTELIVLSSSSHFEDVRGAMRAGASDYLAKGFGRGELLHALEKGLERRRWKQMEFRVTFKAEKLARRLAGESLRMKQLREKIAKIAPAEAPVLISGETGTGKELVASALHDGGRDRTAPFVPVNCAALPASTVDSFFFGHERGAFTGAEKAKTGIFEEADGGTLFLDEVNSLPLELQGRLLRVLQERTLRRLGGSREIPVEFRLVAASNRPLEDLVKVGEFREDLFFRLSVLRLEVPALRDRKEDLDELIAALLPNRRVGNDVKEAFLLHDWPGNVRELKNTLLAMDVMAEEGKELGMEHLPEHALRALSVPAAEHISDIEGFVDEQESREKEFLVRAYRSAKGNVSGMARLLKVDRSHLHQKLVKLGIHQARR